VRNQRWSVDRFIFEEYKTATRSLGIYRILFALYILIYLPKAMWIPSFPGSFYNPPVGLTVFFTSFPGAPFFFVVNGLAIIAAVCLLFGYRTRVASISFAVLLFVLNCWAYSFGKIDHDIPLILVPLIIQQAGWGNGYSIDAKNRPADTRVRKTAAWPLALIALMIGIAMMSAALPKALSGWLDPHAYAVRAHMLNNVFVTGRANWFAEHMLRIKSGLFWKVVDYGTILLEASFLLTVTRRGAFRGVCAFACFFHLGIALTMEIAFVGNILAYGAFVDWPAVESRVPGFLRVWNRILNNISGPWVVSLGVAVAFGYLLFGNPLQLSQVWDPFGLAACLLAAVMAAVFLVGLVRGWFRVPTDSVILFDGFCGLCNGWVDFILRYDRRAAYHFAALQSPAGQDFLRRFGLSPTFDESLVLVEEGQIYCQSSAILRSLRGLGFPRSVGSVCAVVPRAIRDGVYRFVAARGLIWFAKRSTCRVPSPEEASRFL
jgi:predicted DCC family thiol-disulfide oxidoreductase YuxK/uncharacterized membrane protein YphA (DoxX/SURF4 family)